MVRAVVDPDALRDCPTMPATVIAQRIGLAPVAEVRKDPVRILRPMYLPLDPGLAD